MRNPLLVVEHAPDCPPAWLGQWLADDGVTLDVRRPYAGDPLPADLSAHAGLLILGGPQGAYDEAKAPWLSAVKTLVVRAVVEQVPTLGVCLGHQLITVALGGEVVVNPRGQQVGLFEVGWTAAAGTDPLLGPLSTGGTRAVQWNNDIASRLPDGAVVLAETELGEVQAVRFASSVWGVQWHPEVGAAVLGPWVDEDVESYPQHADRYRARLSEVAAAEDELTAGWRELAHRLAAVLGQQPTDAGT